MSNSIRKEVDGKITAKARDGKDYHLNPKVIKEQTTTSRRRGEDSTNSKFKLVTVRRLTSSSLQDVKDALERQQRLLESAAARNNQPVPYPARIPTTEEDLKQTYAVYVDEDLYGTGNPVYTFTSASSNIKAFITANGKNKEDYSVHIGHLVEKIDNKDKTFTVTWRLVTIDNKLNDVPLTYHLLESQSPELHPSFQYNFNIDALQYMGGGCWTAISVDPKDRIPVIAQVQGETDQYIPIGASWKAYGSTRTVCIVAYSMTPSYTFTWCRGKLTMNRRVREASHTTDLSFLKSEGVMKVSKKYSYTLDICQRPDLSTLGNITQVVVPEYANGEAIYVSNTNAPEAPGLDVTPDFGTDARRLAIQSYTQSTNILRPKTFDYSLNLQPNRIVNQTDATFNPVVCSSNDMATFIRMNIGEAVGSINHGFDLKTENAKRGFQYGETYKLWWTYGKVLSFYPTNTGAIYRRSKTAEARGEPSLFPTGETLLNRGELKQSEEYANATETTWDSLPNPPTGFFGLTEGDLTWRIEYSNPPILGHEAVYYYHINPPLPDVDDTLGKLDITASDNQNQLNTLRNLFAQMQGGLGGGTTVNLSLGTIRKASSANDSIVVLNPSPSQKAELLTVPEKFPAGFWETTIYDATYDNENRGYITAYNRDGTVYSTTNH
jgi:hypothetical protein